MTTSNDSTGGWYIMEWCCGKYGSASWWLRRADAENELTRLIQAGLWSGMKPKIMGAYERTI